eukprot:CAMPEP_0169370646 /NCGR_PEP_ID=MMETSP1017-20121227/35465_1 /TAXON_ID=342587 /ORGANISM="Karlodinium micrum, Strain CCMP2283" /LENGTH=113 /DNA_ID=CAMNT_0009469071 /DNA_START=66 /DNA_END=405 /DNA_ORIENTATION=+
MGVKGLKKILAQGSSLYSGNGSRSSLVPSSRTMGVKGLKKKVAAKGKKQMLKFTIDCQQPADDTIIEPARLEKFLKEKIKVDGKTGNLGEKVTVTKEKSKIHVNAESPFSKRY